MTEGGADFNIRLDAISDAYQLDQSAARQLRVFGGMLANDPLAPTTVRDLAKVRDDHLADALVALSLPVIRDARRICDVGAGAGVPGLPLAVALPDAQFTLIEASARKCEFMQRAVEAMGLSNTTVVNGRAETWAAGIGSCDVVTVRAVAALDVIEEYAAPLLKVGGSLVAWRGRREPEAEAEGLRAAQMLGLSAHEPVLVRPYPKAEHRYLHVYLKISETPARFPRRDGVARKRPLGKAPA